VPSSGFAHVQDRISAIQAQIAALSPQRIPAAVNSVPGSTVAPPAGTSNTTFAAALETAVQRQGMTTALNGGTVLPPGRTSIAATAGVLGAGAAAPTTPAAPPAEAPWVVPTRGRVTSDYGPRHGVAGRAHEFHTGLDIAAPTGTPVRAASSGVVRSAGSDGNYGNAVVIDHGNGVTTRYAHNSALKVSVGQQVRAGDEIAAVGSTGRSTGPHLHFEVRVKGEHVDPRAWLAKRSTGS